MNRILLDYSNDKELEIRCKLNNPQIIDIFNHYIKSNNIRKQERSLSIIKDKKRKEIFYDKNNNKINETFIEKKKLHYIKLQNSRNFSAFITLSTESTVDKFNIDTPLILRFKNRISFSINEWRIDITHVLTMEELINIISVKTKFLNNDIFKNDTINTNLLLTNSNLELELEYIGKEFNNIEHLCKIDDAIKLINDIIFKNSDDKLLYNKTIYNIIEKIELNRSSKFIYKTLKQISNQVVTLDFSTYKSNVYNNFDNYYITDKTDGERCFIYISNNVKIITSTLSENKLLSKVDNVYIFDCELVGFNIYIFDILYCNKNITNLILEERLKILESQKSNIENIKIEGKWKINFKIHHKLDKDFKKTINNLMKTSIYEIDGLIISQNSEYNNMKTYKWKMPETQTIDFLVVKPPNNLLNTGIYNVKKDTTLLLLFNTITLYDFQKLNLSHIKNYNEIVGHIQKNNNSKNIVFPFAFRPIINTESYIYYHPNNKPIKDVIDNICEFGCSNGNWDLKRVRYDRKQQLELGLGYGNYYTVAEDIYKFFLDPFPIEKLLEPEKYESKGYFTYNKTNKYKNMIKFNSFVKANLIYFLENSDLVIDLACGKGQDLFTMHGVGIKNMILADIDLNAIIEISKRKNEINNRKFYPFMYKPAKKYSIKTLHIDVISEADITIDKILKLSNQEKANGIIINLAIHYMIKSKQHVLDIINIIDSLLDVGGIFIFTCFDGRKIIELLENTKKNEVFNIYEENEIKYSIKKLYDTPQIGSKIGVKHHFSESYYEEYIVLLDYVINEFIKYNYTVVKHGSFGTYLSNFQSFNKHVYDGMTDNDKLYSSLYSYVTLVKNEPIKSNKIKK